MSKYAYTGVSDTTVVSSVELSTRLPAVTIARDTRPAIGAVTRVNERLSCAASSAALRRRELRPRDGRVGRELLELLARRRVLREQPLRAILVRARELDLGVGAVALRGRGASTSALNGRGSIWNSRSPFATRAPSVNRDRLDEPPTRGRTTTFSTASSRPVKSAQSLSS